MPEQSNNKRWNALAALAVFLLIGTAIYLTVVMASNSRLDDELKDEKLAAESLLSQKLSLDKQISKINSDLSASETKRSNLDRLLSESTRKLENAESDIKHSRGQASSLARLRKLNSELLAQKEGLEQQITDNKNSLTHLQSLNQDLEKTVDVLQKQNNDLARQLDALRLSSIDETLVESTMKNAKQTVKSKRTKNIIVDVDVFSKAKDLNFKITDPSGRELTEKEGTRGVKMISENKQNPNAFYVAAQSSVPPPSYNRVELIYTAKEKLAAGTYKIELFSSSMSIGSLQVKLR